MLRNYHELTRGTVRGSVNPMIKDRQKLFSMRTDTEEGAEFLAALDRLREAERPQLSRTDMVKKLVFEADDRRARTRR